MKIQSQPITNNYFIKKYSDNSGEINNLQPSVSVNFKSLLYSPKSPLHKINPIFRYLDSYFKRSLVVSRKAWLSPDKALAPYMKVINTKDKHNSSIRMWDINKNNNTSYVVFLHGLSHNISSLQKLYKKIISNTNYAVLAPEYHGFLPEDTEDIYLSPKKLLNNTNTAIKYLESKGISHKDISIVGHSFGGYPAALIAKKYPDLKQVILVSSINTNEHQIQKLKERRFRHIPKSVKYLVDRCSILSKPIQWLYNTGRLLNKVDVPIDMIHSTEDKYIKMNTSLKLASQCKNLRSFNTVKGYHRMDDLKIEKIIELLNSTKN